MVKISLNTVTRECIADSNFLGFEGENQANVLDFSFSGEHIDGTAVLNIKRGKDTGFVAVDKVGNGYQLPVRSSLLSQVGDITFQFVITTPSGAIMKFDSFVMTVEDAIDTDVPLPEEYPSWVEMANYKLAEVDAAITRANSTSNQLLQDKENGVFDGKDGVDGRNGINGISPTVATEETATGTKITITDINGTHVAEILNGERGATGATGPIGPRGLTGPQGPQGPAGKDGAVSFEELTEEQKATLKGDKGDKGDTGPQGEQGPKGDTGATGPQGPEGPQGPKGDKGDTGETGATGETGPEGPQGETGPAGKDGLTPYIGENGNWWIGDTDTGVKASGSGEGGTGGVVGSQTVLFDGEYTNTTELSPTGLLSDSIYNYDLVFLTTFQKSNADATYTRIMTIPIDPKIIQENYAGIFANTLWVANCAGNNYSQNDAYMMQGNFGDGTQLAINRLTTQSQSTNRIHGICKVVGVKYGSGSGGSSYREQELLSSPIVYSITNGRSWNNINANIDFAESVDNFDELSFVIELGNDSGYYHVRHHSIKVSDIIYNNSETTVYDGSHIQIPFGIQNIICNLGGWFKTGNRFWAVNIGTYNIVDSGVAFPKVRLRSVKGIKY